MRGICCRRWWLRLLVAGLVIVGAFVSDIVPAVAAPLGPPTVLAGQTTQGFPSYFKISPNGRMLETGQTALMMNCSSGAMFALPTFVSHIRIGASGRTRTAGQIPPGTLSGGGIYTGTESMSAKLNRVRTEIAGVWRLRMSYTFTDGTSDQCDSGPVRFVDSR